MKNNDQLLLRAKEGDKTAKNQLVEENLGLVHHIVKRYVGRGVETEDLFQIGSIGLMKAIENFDMSFGVQFSTYAVPLIQGEIKRFFRDDGIIKISRNIKENSFKIKKEANLYFQQYGKEATIAELCQRTGLEKEDIVLALESLTEVESIYKTMPGQDGSEQFLVDRISGGMDEGEKLVDRVLLSQLLNTLKGKEKELIFMRYFEEKTQTEVAEKLGMSQVQVSRLEKKILLGLRKIVHS